MTGFLEENAHAYSGNSACPSRKLTLRPRVSFRDGQRVEGFIRMTGVTVDDLRGHVSDPGNLGAVLDYLLADERCLLEFTERVGVAPELPYAARRMLKGAIPVWRSATTGRS